MKNLRYVLFFLTVLLVATAAQAQQLGVKADVPFNFVVGNNAYPAGEYTIKPVSESFILIRNDNLQEHASGTYITNTCTRSASSSATSKLVFHRMGDQYFLSQVWTGRDPAGKELPMGRAGTQLAKNLAMQEPLIVAAKITR